ncbi:MAG: M3 family metallopeptidase, partial [Comamonas sp.]
MTNALLESSSLPQFDRITPADVGPAINTLIERAQAALETVTAPDFPAEWNAIAKVLDVATEKLGTAWSAVSHLSSVADSPELRAAYNEALPTITEFWTNLGADERLYAKYKAIDVNTLTAEQKKAHANALRSFVLSGAELQGADRERFAKIQERSAELGQKFSENTLDATDGWAYYATQEELDGVPADVQQAAKAAAQADGKEGYKLTLKIPSYLPVMQFAHSSALREKVYRAYVTRASDQAEGDLAKYDNAPIIKEMLALRQEEAELLGYANFAEVSLVPKMANSPQQVIDFLRDLARRARPYAEKDVADLREFAAKELGITDPQPWDWTYISEKLKEARYSFSEQEVKQYFTAPKVLAGLFKIIENLFDVKITKDLAAVWNKDVLFYRLERNGQVIGQFYLDQPARKGKRGGAWMDDVRSRWQRPDTGLLQTPVAHMVCNFAEGVDGKPALLTHDDVITLFHESGHALHHMLT